jgi:hypothetical protein
MLKVMPVDVGTPMGRAHHRRTERRRLIASRGSNRSASVMSRNSTRSTYR